MIDYQLDPLHRIAITRVRGAFTFAELANHLHRLVRDRGFQADFDSMIVAADVDAVPPPAAVGTLAPLVRAWSSRRRGARWAFVLPTAATLRFAERALQEVRLQDVTVRCFADEATASRWLQAARDTPKKPAA